MDTDITWAAYLRLSRLKSKKTRVAKQRGRYRSADESVERQLRLIRAYAEEHGLYIPDHLIFRDNGRSGWQKPGGPPPHRPDWDRMIEAGKNGAFGGVLVWKVSRFARNVRDGEDLLDLQLVVDGPDSGRIDLTTPSGRSTFRKQVEAAANESDEISSRVRIAQADMLAMGYRIGGPRAFGFEVLSETELDPDLYEDDDEGRLIGPAAVYRHLELDAIREMGGRFLDGEQPQRLTDELNERGIYTTHGHKWEVSNFLRTLGRPINGGYIAKADGTIVGKLSGVEPIFDPDTYEAIRAKLDARKRGRSRYGTYWLSGELLCRDPDCPRNAEDSKRRPTMVGRFAKSRNAREYICNVRGSVPGCGQVIRADEVEDRARDAVLAALKDAVALDAMRAADTALADKRAELSNRLEELDVEMAETEGKLNDVPLSMTRRREQLNLNLKNQTRAYVEIERELESLGVPEGPGTGPQLPALTVEQWEHDTSVEEKAALLRRLRVRVEAHRPTPGWHWQYGFDEQRVRITQDSPVVALRDLAC